jgi:hypothetical protein
MPTGKFTKSIAYTGGGGLCFFRFSLEKKNKKQMDISRWFLTEEIETYNGETLV